MAKTRRMVKNQLKTSMKHHNVGNCYVKLFRLNLKSSMFKNALFKMYGISDCRIQLVRLENKPAASAIPEKKRLSTSKAKSVRFQVPWLPTIDNVTSSVETKEKPKSKEVAGKPGPSRSFYVERSVDVIGCDEAINSSESSKPQIAKLLPAHRHRSLSISEERPKPTNEDRSVDVIGCDEAINSSQSSKPQIAKLLPAHRQRSLSISEERPKPTNEDIHSELLEKLNTPNRSLRAASRRSVPDSPPKIVPEWKKVFEEFKKKLAERHRAETKAEQKERIFKRNI